MSIAMPDAGGAPVAAAGNASQGVFAYCSQQYRVVFGAGTSTRLGEEAERLGIKRALVLTTLEQQDLGRRLGAGLGEKLAGLFSGARMHTPVEVTHEALGIVESRDINGLVAIGGGSTVGLGKALSLRTGLPHIAMPTTYAGSEMTPILGETTNGIKTTQHSQDLVPDTVIYDVDLTVSLPPRVSAASGLNAIAHAVEALYAPDANPLTSLMAEDSIAALARALPRILVEPADAGARRDALYGAWLCGVCLGAVGMSLHHKLCHVLGGMFDLPHAETHAIMLPHAAAYNAVAAPDAMTRIARALRTTDAPRGLFDLVRRLALPRRLADIGMPEDGIARAAEMAVRSPYANPRPVERAAIHDLIAAAWRGDAPAQH
ncbi:maleylacetate reductase [Bradyrhizobium sp. ISRA443]|uniref:maleylacetate reductase n=1 Tax=unclassified Bradyrhizobium TaxID=2631580 RepID=UPI002478F39D|nr:MULTISPECIES: maleylacetate reductase [unclassified Bradyrhizobium]WGR93026.1 maleylacetate reductase [Bradyrhizobium sp. ISRA435]WGR97520.1 maleylacetate reductase [Bradyrhizobium sp. ISRA436]WGS04410.1 maleylacetate reductase [Bradyrhizobium sp. ISRA437]WGS11291.1 maleylacetate reductase [Bradyrhizobium sp. ISRA443]